MRNHIYKVIDGDVERRVGDVLDVVGDFLTLAVVECLIISKLDYKLLIKKIKFIPLRLCSIAYHTIL